MIETVHAPRHGSPGGVAGDMAGDVAGRELTGHGDRAVTRHARPAQPVLPVGLGAARVVPLWLTQGRWPLFACVHEPTAPPRAAVVVCPPLLAEHVAAFDLQRMMAVQLSELGILAVRFDYEGSGNSGGPCCGGGRLDAWLDGVDQAIAAARQRCGGPVALVGVRSGALVAAMAAGRRRDVDAAVLWDPWKTGRSFLRRQHALHALRQPGVPAADVVEVPGFVLDARAAKAVEALRLPPALHVRRALLVHRAADAAPTLEVDGVDAGAGGPGTVETLVAAAGEQESCFDVDALSRRAPTATVTSVVAWLDGAFRDLGDVPRTAHVPRSAHASRPLGEDPGRASERVPATEWVQIRPASPGEVSVRERVLWLGSHRFFAIETAPDSDAAAPGDGDVSGSDPVAVLLTSGTDPHVGPSRVWVDLARRAAASGRRCIRVDLSGFGESAPRAGRPSLVLRAPEAFDDVSDIVNAVGGPDRTVLVGLCSGAYQALESALELHPLAALGVNPILRFTPPELAETGAIATRRRLCEPRQSWVPVVRRRMPRQLIRAAVWFRRTWRLHRTPPQRRGWLDELAAAGVGVYLVCGTEEIKAIPAVRAAGTGHGSGGDRVRVDLIEGLDHALTVAAHRADVIDRLVARLNGIAALGPRAGRG